MTIYCDVFECKNYNNGICTNKFETGEKAVKMHMNCMGQFICTDMDVSEECTDEEYRGEE